MRYSAGLAGSGGPKGSVMMHMREANWKGDSGMKERRLRMKSKAGVVWMRAGRGWSAKAEGLPAAWVAAWGEGEVVGCAGGAGVVFGGVGGGGGGGGVGGGGGGGVGALMWVEVDREGIG